MTPSLAIAPIIVSLLILAGLAIMVFGNIWTLVVAAQRSILWLLGVLLVPFVGFILLFVEPKSRKPFVVALLGAGMAIGGFVAADPGMFQNGRIVDQILRPLTGEKNEGVDAAASDDTGTLEERKARVRTWQGQLEAKRAALKPTDPEGKARFDEEFKQYLAALEKVKAEMAAQPKP